MKWLVQLDIIRYSPMDIHVHVPYMCTLVRASGVRVHFSVVVPPIYRDFNSAGKGGERTARAGSWREERAKRKILLPVGREKRRPKERFCYQWGERRAGHKKEMAKRMIVLPVGREKRRPKESSATRWFCPREQAPLCAWGCTGCRSSSPHVSLCRCTRRNGTRLIYPLNSLVLAGGQKNMLNCITIEGVRLRRRNCLLYSLKMSCKMCTSRSSIIENSRCPSQTVPVARKPLRR
jgi:hypothetical protein